MNWRELGICHGLQIGYWIPVFIVSCEKQLFHIYSVRIQCNCNSCVQQYDTTVSDGLTVGDCLKMAAITVLHDLFT